MKQTPLALLKGKYIILILISTKISVKGHFVLFFKVGTFQTACAFSYCMESILCVPSVAHKLFLPPLLSFVRQLKQAMSIKNTSGTRRIDPAPYFLHTIQRRLKSFIIHTERTGYL